MAPPPSPGTHRAGRPSTAPTPRSHSSEDTPRALGWGASPRSESGFGAIRAPRPGVPLGPEQGPALLRVSGLWLPAAGAGGLVSWRSRGGRHSAQQTLVKERMSKESEGLAGGTSEGPRGAGRPCPAGAGASCAPGFGWPGPVPEQTPSRLLSSGDRLRRPEDGGLGEPRTRPRVFPTPRPRPGAPGPGAHSCSHWALGGSTGTSWESGSRRQRPAPAPPAPSPHPLRRLLPTSAGPSRVPPPHCPGRRVSDSRPRVLPRPPPPAELGRPLGRAGRGPAADDVRE